MTNPPFSRRTLLAAGTGLLAAPGLLLRPGQPAEVFGDEIVLLVNGRRLRRNDYGQAALGKPVGGQGFEMSILVAGDTLPATP